MYVGGAQKKLGCADGCGCGGNCKGKGLGDATSDALATFATGATSSPFLYIGAGLLVAYLVLRMKNGPAPRRRRRNVITPLTAAIYAAGAGAGGYLLGKYSGL
jgi:hypothetical protein